MDFSVWTTRWPYLLEGALISLELVALVTIISTPLAALVAVGLTSRNTAVARATAVVSWIMRGIPPLVILFVAYFVLPEYGVNLSPMVAAVLGFAACNMFLLGEVIAGGFRSIPAAQHQAIAALGLPPLRAYWRLMLPQALPAIIPPYISYTTDMVKGTALAGSIGVLELVTRANQAILATNRPFEILIGVAVIYGTVDAVLMSLQAIAERAWASSRRR
jgi:His/Glu/Gln/Arg/opine family amino acid ABC transporter permease subunit